MPRLFSEYVAITPTAHAVDDIMHSTQELLAFLERHESSRFLEALKNDIVAEVQWNEQSSARQAALRAEILQTTSYSTLASIHSLSLIHI